MAGASHRIHRLLIAVLMISLLAALPSVAQPPAQNADEPKPKHAIPDVMKGAHVAPRGSRSLRDRVLAGEATPKEQQELLDFYISLAENVPPQGEVEAWQQKTRAVLIGAAKIVAGREGAADQLRRATTCAACHRDHRPPSE